MNAQEFNNQKSIDHKANLVWDIGTYIDERAIYGKYIIKMYTVYHLIVEVWVNTKSLKIEKIKALEDETDWKGYLASVNLENLY